MLIFLFGIILGIDYFMIGNINNNYLLLFYLISEIMIGLILGYIINLVFEVVRFVGLWMDIYVGFLMVIILDLISKIIIILFGNLLYFFLMVFFFLVDGYYVIINMIVESIKIIFIGKMIVY